MSEYEIRSVGGHVEVYTRGGVFLFSADTVREAMEELDEAAYNEDDTTYDTTYTFLIGSCFGIVMGIQPALRKV